eukprot:jgi/Chrzof1/10369/Cz04g39120.t1
MAPTANNFIDASGIQAVEPTTVQPSCPMKATMSIFDKLGGRDAVKAAVEVFYAKILADDSINQFFKDVDMKTQRAKQYAFMSYALGGPEKYRGKDMVTAHKHLKITEEHFNAVAGHFVATLQELNVPADIISEAAAVVVAAKPQVVNTPAA